jgi:hypothetical protein
LNLPRGRMDALDWAARAVQEHGKEIAPRRRDALDWASEAVKAHGYELAQAFVEAAKRGDWRASEALMNRIYGKP